MAGDERKRPSQDERRFLGCLSDEETERRAAVVPSLFVLEFV
jgi:hypothetical protein